MDFKEKLKARAEKEGISLTPKQLGQFELFTKCSSKQISP